MNDIFPNIVGQPITKNKLSFFIENSRQNGILPNILFVGPKGAGKTELARSLARQIKQKDGKPREFLKIGSATLANVRQFINQIYVPYNMIRREVTLFFDEAHAMKPDLSTEFLNILDVTKDNKTLYTLDGTVYEFDFARHAFLFATTESNKIFAPLVSRFERIDLEDYTPADLALIIGRNLDGVEYDENMLIAMTQDLRPNPREAVKFAGHMRNYLISKNKRRLSPEDWRYVRNRLGLLPLGLNRTELKILRVLDDRAEASLTALASVTNMSRDSLQKDNEMYLLSRKLIDIGCRGRRITNQGREYLRSLDDKVFYGNV